MGILNDLLTILLLSMFGLVSTYVGIILWHTAANTWLLAIPGFAIDILLGIIIYRRLWPRR